MTDNAADLRAEIDALKERVARLEKELAQLKMKQERAELQRRSFSSRLRLRIRRLHECIAASMAAPYLARRLFIWMPLS